MIWVTHFVDKAFAVAGILVENEARLAFDSPRAGAAAVGIVNPVGSWLLARAILIASTLAGVLVVVAAQLAFEALLVRNELVDNSSR